MKMTAQIRVIQAGLSASLFFCSPAGAVSLTFDADPATAGAQDGSGTWNTTNTNWWDGAFNTNWSSATPDGATFGAGGAAGTVTLGTALSVGNITFAPVGSGSYTIAGRTNLTLVGTPVITTDADGRIDSFLGGTGFSKAGAGRLTLANNTAGGTATIGAGTLILTNGSWSGPVAVSNGATLVALGGPGLLGQYFNVSPPNVNNQHPSFATFTNTHTYLAGLNDNILFGSAAAGTGVAFDFNFAGTNFPPGYFPGGANFQVRWVGKVRITTAGPYYFDTASDDGSMLFVDGQLVVNNNFYQGVVTRSGVIYLTAGLHDIVVTFYQGGGGYGMYADMAPLGGTVSRISNSVLSSGPGIETLSGEAGSALVVSNGQLTVAQASAGTFAGGITGDGGLYKMGTAPLTLSGVSAYSGETTVAGGTLVLTEAGGLSNSAALSLLGGTLDITSIPGYTIRSGQPLAGFGTVSGAVAVADGANFLPGGHRVAGTLAFSSDLTLSAGVTNYFDLSSTPAVGGLNDLVTVGGNLTIGGPLIVSLVGAGTPAGGPYRLANYAGTLAGTFSSVSAANTRSTLGVDYGAGAASQIDLYVTNQPAATLRWNGTTSALWDVSTSANWFNLGTLAADKFYQGDSVLFDDTAGVQTNVTVVDTVSPAVLVVSNSAQQYTFTGNKITGAATLNKLGTNILVLANVTANDFTGGLNVSGGVVRVGTVGVLGPNNTNITVAAGGQVQLNGVAQGAYNYVYRIAGSGPNGSGAIMNTNANIGTASTVKWLELTADAAVGSYGTLATDNGRWDLGLGGGLQGNGFTLTKVGNNVMPMRGSATNLQVVVAEGFVYVESVNDALGSNALVQSGAFLAAYGARTIATPITLNGGTLSTRNGGGACTWTGPVSVPTNAFIASAPGVYGFGAEPINIHGGISGNGGVTVFGNSTTTFRGTNTYAGPTVLRNAGGTLVLSTVGGYSIVGPVQVGHLDDGGGAAVLQANVDNQFGPATTVAMGGSPGDFTYLKAMGTVQYLGRLTSDDNGGGVLENTESDPGIGTMGTLNIRDAGDSYFSGSYIRDRSGSTNIAPLRIVMSGSGSLTLASGTQSTYSGGLIVSNGTVNLKTRHAAGTAPITLAGGSLTLDGFGLQEGSVSQPGINTTSPCPLNTGVKLSTPRPNHGNGGAGDFGGNTTWIYSGYLVVTNTTPVTYTFGESIDDNGWLQIDGLQVLNDGTWNVPTIGTITLAPGLHRFDARFYNGGGGSGAQTQGGWTNTLGFGIDRLGRNQNVFTNFTAITDPGDGSFLISEVTVTNDITLAAGTSLKVSNRLGPTNTISGAISDGGSGFGITKTGAGALTLSGVNTYAGPTVVSNGTLFVNGVHVGSGAYTVASNALLGGTGIVGVAAATVEDGGCIGERNGGLVGTLTVNGLTLNTGARIACQLNGATPTLNVTAPFATGSSNAVEIYSALAPVAPGTYTLVQYTGGVGGGGAAALTLADPLPNGAQGYLTNNTVNSTIQLVITNAGAGIRWLGPVNNVWDVGGTFNWSTMGGALATVFNPYDAVRFDDLATGNHTVFLAQAVAPSSVTVSNNTAAYALTGSFGITGTATLAKQGGGLLTMSTAAHRYTGATTVDGGTVVVNATRPFGDTAGITINAGGQVNLNGKTQGGVGYSYTIAGDGPDGSGAIVNTNAAVNNLDGGISNLTLSGNASLGAYSGGFDGGARFDLCLGGTLNGGGFQITKLGSSALDFRGTTVNLTNILVSAGTIYSETRNDAFGQNVVAMPGTQVGAYGGVTNSARIVLNGATLAAMGGAPCTWSGDIVLNADSTIHTAPPFNYGTADILINGRVTGAAGFAKHGTQVLTLTASNDYAGPTVIYAGTVRITNDNDRLPMATALTVNGSDTGTALLDLTDRNQTIGSLSGTNTYGASISLGAGTLTISGGGSGSYFGKITGAGGLVRAGSGVQTLNASNTYAGGTTINSGTMNIRHHDALGQGAVTLNGGTLGLDAAGLWEGRVPGAFETVAPNPKWAANLTTEKANSTVNTVYPDNTTYIYTGYLTVTGTSPATWSFVKRFDDSGLLRIDGVALINQTGWDQTIVATATLSPGVHTFEVRTGEGAGGIGPTAGWPIGFGYDTLGRNQPVITNFTAMTDAGDGSLFWRDDLVFTNAITLNADAAISAPVGATKVAVSGPIGGTAGFAKTGGGALLLTGGNTYAGNTIVSNGALFVNGANAGAGSVTVAAGAQLWGSGSLAGAATVQAGGFIGARNGVTNAGVTLTMPALTLDTGATVGGFLNGTNPTINVTGANALSVGTSNLVVIIPSAPVAAGTYPLIAYNTSLGGSGFGGLVLGTLPNGAQGYLNNNTGAGLVELVITNAGGGLKWYGSTGNGTWDVLTTPNWAALPAAVAATFQNLDAVLFDDTASNFTVSVATAVHPAGVAISNETQAYTFSNGGIGGPGGLTKDGAAKLTLSNANTYPAATLIRGGTVSIIADSSLGTPPAAFTPAHLQVAGGTLESLGTFALAGNRGLSVGPAAGTGAGTVAVVSGATLTVNTVITNTPGGTGELVKNGPGTLVIGPAARHTGGTTVNDGTLQLNTGGTAGTLAGGSNLTINSGGRVLGNSTDAIGYFNGGGPTSVNINGTGILTINAGLRYSVDQTVNMVGGVMASQGGGDGSGCTYTLRNSNGGVYNFTSTTDGVPAVISATGIGLNGATVFNVADGAGAADLVVSGNLRDNFSAGGLTKEGDGVLVLSASNNAYTLDTTVNGGALVVGDGVTGSLGTSAGAITVNGALVWNLPGTSALNNVLGGTGVLVQAGSGRLVLHGAGTYSGGTLVSNGVLVAHGTTGSGPVYVAPGATLAGTGSVGVVTSDGVVAPGGSAGVLNVGQYTQNTGGVLAIEIGGAAAGTDYDQVNCGGPASLGGTLQVVLINGYSPVLNDTFIVLASTGISGGFAVTNLPVLNPGLAWSVDYLAGSFLALTVVSGPAGGFSAYAQQIPNPAQRDYLSDPDGDGYANLLEYVTAGNPTNVDTNARMDGGRTNGALTLRFLRNTNAFDAVIHVEAAFASTNNAPWSSIAMNSNGLWSGAASVTETGTTNPVNVTVEDVAPGSTNRFLRLRVTGP